jgi:hypothetical protein
MISGAEQCVCNQIIRLNGPICSEDIVTRQDFARASGVQPGKIVPQRIRTADGTVGKRCGGLEHVAMLILGKLAQLVDGNGGAACFSYVVLAVVLVLVHPLWGVSVVLLRRGAFEHWMLTASTENRAIFTILNYASGRAMRCSKRDGCARRCTPARAYIGEGS